MNTSLQTSRGFPLPYGVSKHPDGYNFSLFSKNATAVHLCLYQPDNQTLLKEISLDPQKNKTGHVWHIFIQGLPSSLLYGYRLEGPYSPLEGHFFDSRAVLLDPHAKLVVGPPQWITGLPKSHLQPQLGFVEPFEPFDWGDDVHPNIPLEKLIIYEMHVRGFTIDPSSHVQNPGTFLGLIEKIPYLKSLGVNAIELMPIHEFQEWENPLLNPSTKQPLCQYWGYSTVNFFSPMRRYGTVKGNTINEFKSLVKALHANGIEVILDVVYNHTVEGNQTGPLISFKGIENSVYYMLGPNGEYYNFSGCGNTVNCNHPAVRQLIMESLRYWVTEMHVDGFRFDLASILVRSHDGIPLEHPPLIEAISLDPVLANTKLIAESWDAGGLYQVGTFPGLGIWSEWNGRYRDDVRRFIKGSEGEIGNFATRLSGSEDLYAKIRRPATSINFVTAHDGFSLADLVSYNQKHNLENGENNHDGMSNNDSWNCGAEGETKDPQVLALRQRQMRNFHVALMISQGVPMLLMGDEYGHTKKGNNNTWCHDSRLNWFQWEKIEQNAAFYRFYTKLIAFRKEHAVFSRNKFLRDADILWHGKEPLKADWSRSAKFLAFSLFDPEGHYKMYVAFNSDSQPVTFHLPIPFPHQQWVRIVDTSLLAPEDFTDEDKQPKVKGESYTLSAYSSLILKCSKN